MGAKKLFSGITFSINEEDRIGLVGNNGCGKTSLVRALLGEIELDGGEVSKKKNLRIGYASQEIPDSVLTQTPYDFLLNSLPEQHRDTDFWKVDVALSEIGLREDLWHRPLSSLSGGWKRLILFSGATISEPDLLIFDEPTNHLDLGKVFRLEQWLTENVRVPYLVISHDREFLDRCTSKTIFMRSDSVYEFGASFTVARDNLLQEDARAARAHDREGQEIKRLEKSAKRMNEWARKGTINPDLARRAKAVQTRADQLRERQTQKYVEERRDIKLHEDSIPSDTVLVVKDTVVKTPDGRELFKIDRLVVNQGDRIAILGLNGAGKSVFIRRLVEEFRNYEPGPGHLKEIYFNPQLKLGYLDQHLTDLPDKARMFDFVSSEFKLDRTGTTRELANIGFPQDQQTKPIHNLSYGERARLSLLALRLSRPNFYILDEPTNHLDIQGQEALEEELDDKAHTCVFVSHDRRLLRGAATRFFEIKSGKLVEVESVEPFFEKIREAEDMEDADPAPAPAGKPKKNEVKGPKPAK